MWKRADLVAIPIRRELLEDRRANGISRRGNRRRVEHSKRRRRRALPSTRDGRIAVSFTTTQEAWQLTVDDSGITIRSHGSLRDDAPDDRAAARLEARRTAGGSQSDRWDSLHHHHSAPHCPGLTERSVKAALPGRLIEVSVTQQ